MRVSIQLPPSYRADLVGSALLVARAEARESAAAALDAGGTLHDWAAAAAGRPPLEGRGPVHVAEVNGRGWVVRRYRRGGAVARVLGDRYLDRGVPRPARELLASETARRRGVPTPAVLAFAIYPAGVFYRADLATEWIPDSADLAAVLFEGDRHAAEREAACEVAGALVRRMAEAGVVHPDLNLKNVLIAWDDDRVPRAHLLDLDRCRVLERAGGAEREAMLRRFLRSAAKWERRTGRPFGAAERAAFEAAFRDGAPA